MQYAVLLVNCYTVGGLCPLRDIQGNNKVLVLRAAIVGCIRCAKRFDVRAAAPVGELCAMLPGYVCTAKHRA